ncbi:hypothetical protein BJ878DRAFT_483803 [Calycina marina]|uniref:Uncharacterized protein n=1 Tax=Calycina marina TaxID=1763456 RepID=A0A9P7YWQ4_9HELO|nr:hypothetical protein BJ878DRAFT_483803 [Calycina marina]
MLYLDKDKEVVYDEKESLRPVDKGLFTGCGATALEFWKKLQSNYKEADPVLATCYMQLIQGFSLTKNDSTKYTHMLTVTEKLKMLEEKEQRAKASEKLCENDTGLRDLDWRDRNISGLSRNTSPKEKADFTRRCYVCNGSHFVKDCAYLGGAREYVEALKGSQAEVEKKCFGKSNTKSVSFRKSDFDKMDTDIDKTRPYRGKTHNNTAFVADTDDTAATSSSNEEYVNEEVANVAKGLLSVLFVPGPGVNLISARQLCAVGLAGEFDTHFMRLLVNGVPLIIASQKGGLYIVDHIYTENTHHVAFISLDPRSKVLPSAPSAVDIDDVNTLDTLEDDADFDHDSTESQRKIFDLYYRMFCHLGPKKIQQLHEVTDLEKTIKVSRPGDRKLCGICALTKMRDRINRELSDRPSRKVELIQCDIAGPWHTSIRKNR